MKYPDDFVNKIVLGDCLDILKQIPNNSLDSCVTDPPYGLSFMGKKWDYDVPSIEVWKECLRVLKPGGYLLAFAGTRTQHRMAVRIEDAGFEIRDMIAWVYGSGFPKSLNIGKAVDKLQGNERKEFVDESWLRRNPSNERDDIYELGMKSGISGAKRTKGTSEWEGWGTALKPALEPITVARKPLDGTVAENCLKWGVGGINIDGCRVKGDDWDEKTVLGKYRGSNVGKESPTNAFGVGEIKCTSPESTLLGRFPANLIHDGSDEVVSLFPNTKSPATYIRKSSGYSTGNSGIKTIGEQAGAESLNYGDSGSAARFFYCAKSSKSERNKGCEELEEKLTVGEGKNTFKKGLDWNIDPRHPDGGYEVKHDTKMRNNHPTVKPVALMRYLVKLVTPKNGTVLDPFMGSGTTGIACKNLGYKFIGIEKEPEYITIAKARIDYIKTKQQVLL